MKTKSNDLDLISRGNPYLKISKNPHSNLGEKMNIPISKLYLPILIEYKLHKLQGLRRNHSTNPIDVKIGLQIGWIEEYFFGFFFDVHSAFKG